VELFQLILLAVTTPFALIWLFLAAAKGKNTDSIQTALLPENFR
jgi:hypothetical protein